MKRTKGYISEVFGSFQGEGPRLGERHVFVRFAGCGMGCAYCDTPGSAARTATALLEVGPGGPSREAENPLSVEDVVEAVLAQEVYPGFNAALSVTGGEPLEQPEFLEALLAALAGRLPVVLETGGALYAPMDRLRGLVDEISMDVKLPSVTGLGPLWEEHELFMRACRGKGLVVKAVVSEKTPDEEMAHAAALAAKNAPYAALVIQPVGAPDRLPAVSGTRLAGLYAAARARHAHVRVIPQAHRIMGVR